MQILVSLWCFYSCQLIETCMEVVEISVMELAVLKKAVKN